MTNERLSPTPEPKQSALIGLGLDNEDGHKRITHGEKFAILGGSEETHEKMTESVLKTFEDLKRRGKLLEHASSQEVADLLKKHQSQ